MRAEAFAAEHDLGVLITNILFATEDSDIVRHGATTSTVLRPHLDQYKVEYTYRLMKSGMGVDSVYVHTPQRADALLFVVVVATLTSSVIDALHRRNGCGFPTVRRPLRLPVHDVRVPSRYGRGHGRQTRRVRGPCVRLHRWNWGELAVLLDK